MGKVLYFFTVPNTFFHVILSVLHSFMLCHVPISIWVYNFGEIGKRVCWKMQCLSLLRGACVCVFGPCYAESSMRPAFLTVIYCVTNDHGTCICHPHYESICSINVCPQLIVPGPNLQSPQWQGQPGTQGLKPEAQEGGQGLSRQEDLCQNMKKPSGKVSGRRSVKERN